MAAEKSYKKRPHVFISYAREDQQFAERLSEDLRKAGVRVWRDVEQLMPGTAWHAEIDSALRRSAAILYVSSRNSVNSKWIKAELKADLTNRIGAITIPIVLDEIGELDLPNEIRSFQWADFRNSYKDAFSNLKDALPKNVFSKKAVPSLPEISKGYVFISYSEDDTDFVASLREYLKDRKHGYWDYAENDRNYHTQFVRELEGVINDSSATLCILSESWKDSTWALREYFYSEEIGKPVFLMKAKAMGPSLAIAGSPYIDFVMNPEAGFERLSRELTRKGL